MRPERRPRPRVPLAVQVAVAERQVGFGPKPDANKRGRLLGLLIMLFGAAKAHLDHDPPLRARGYNPRIKDVAARYTPNANDPAFLIWRVKDGNEPSSHRVKTYVRGEHGQYSDVVLIKRERRRERKKEKAKARWPRRKMRSANRWPPKGSRKLGGRT